MSLCSFPGQVSATWNNTGEINPWTARPFWFEDLVGCDCIKLLHLCFWIYISLPKNKWMDVKLSFLMLKNGQTYFRNLTVWTTQDFKSTFDHFSALCIKEIRIQDISWHFLKQTIDQKINNRRGLLHHKLFRFSPGFLHWHTAYNLLDIYWHTFSKPLSFVFFDHIILDSGSVSEKKLFWKICKILKKVLTMESFFNKVWCLGLQIYHKKVVFSCRFYETFKSNYSTMHLRATFLVYFWTFNKMDDQRKRKKKIR